MYAIIGTMTVLGSFSKTVYVLGACGIDMQQLCMSCVFGIIMMVIYTQLQGIISAATCLSDVITIDDALVSFTLCILMCVMQRGSLFNSMAAAHVQHMLYHHAYVVFPLLVVVPVPCFDIDKGIRLCPFFC